MKNETHGSTRKEAVQELKKKKTFSFTIFSMFSFGGSDESFGGSV